MPPPSALAALPVDRAAPQREQVLQLLRRHGWNATSFQVLEPGYEF